MFFAQLTCKTVLKEINFPSFCLNQIYAGFTKIILEVEHGNDFQEKVLGNLYVYKKYINSKN